MDGTMSPRILLPREGLPANSPAPPAKIAGVTKMVCGAASLNGLKNLLKILKQIKKTKLDSKSCYQSKILPSNGKLSKVSKKKC
jgi:hypothetical protein